MIFLAFDFVFISFILAISLFIFVRVLDFSISNLEKNTEKKLIGVVKDFSHTPDGLFSTGFSKVTFTNKKTITLPYTFLEKGDKVYLVKGIFTGNWNYKIRNGGGV